MIWMDRTLDQRLTGIPVRISLIDWISSYFLKIVNYVNEPVLFVLPCMGLLSIAEKT